MTIKKCKGSAHFFVFIREAKRSLVVPLSIFASFLWEFEAVEENQGRMSS
jgi:hypothetical protein